MTLLILGVTRLSPFRVIISRVISPVISSYLCPVGLEVGFANLRPGVDDFRFRGSGLIRFRFQGLGFRFQGLGFRVQGLGFRVQGLGLRVQGLGFRV